MNINKNKFLSVIIIAVLFASLCSIAAIAVPAKAQTVPSGVFVGPPFEVELGTTGVYATYTGTVGAVPAGVTPQQYVQTIPYLSFIPNPIGVGQILTVNVWVNPALSVAKAFQGYQVNIVQPDGSNITVPMDSYEGDTTAFFEWSPSTAGNYTIQFQFLGEYFPAGTYTDGIVNNTAGEAVVGAAPATFTQSVYEQPSETAPYTLVVQPNYVASVQPSPLPVAGQYWSRPISPDNREWWTIGGNDPNYEVGGGAGWPANTNDYGSTQYAFVPYSTGPTSAHIVWSMLPDGIDGINGGAIDGASTNAISPPYDWTGADFTFGQTGPGAAGNPNIVFDGRCYQTIVESYLGSTPQPMWQCFNIQTGQVYWQIEESLLTDSGHVLIPTLISYSTTAAPVPGGKFRSDETAASLIYFGASAVSGTGLVIKYNPITGAIVTNATVPFTSGTLYADPYILSVQTTGSGATAKYWLCNWTLDGLQAGATYTTIPGIQSNFTLYNLVSNISFPFASLGLADFGSMITTTTYSATNPATGTATPWSGGGQYSTSAVWIAAASLTTGALLWNESSGVPYPIFSGGADVADHGMVAIRFDDGYYYSYSLLTGALEWQSQLSSYPWGTFGAYFVQSAFGLLYYEQYDGVVAYNWTNGQIAWWYQAPSNPFENDFNNGTGNLGGTVYPFFTDAVITSSGDLYTYSYEHSPTAPITRDFATYCINALTGAQIWTITDPMDPGVVTDGYMTATDYYSAAFYTFGMGLSATTVSAPLTPVTAGTPFTITGTVLDESPAQPGTPAVSDASMGAWMGFLHLQAPHPTSVTGVPVILEAINSTGSIIPIATVTSDGTTGTFGYSWTPTTPGTYEIYAVFAGTDAYAFSTAATYTTVVAAPTATVTPTPTSTPTQSPTSSPVANLATNADVMTYIVVAAIAIIIAIAIVGLLILRKK